MVNHLLKRHASDEAITKVDEAILCITQLAGMTWLQYNKALIDKSICVRDANNEGAKNNKFIERIQDPIRHSSCRYWSTNPQTNVIDLPF